MNLCPIFRRREDIVKGLTGLKELWVKGDQWISGSVDQWWKVLPRRSRDQTQATRGVNDPPQGQLACLVLLPFACVLRR
jgi:hypothetical protein